MDFSKKSKLSTQLYLQIIIVAAILILVNFLSYKFFFRADLTQDKQYTISKVSKDTVSKLDDILTVKVFFSKKLPSNLIFLNQYVHDILSEYQAYANKNFQVKYIDPADDEQVASEVQTLGIPKVQMNVLEKDKFQAQEGYLGIGVFYGDNNEVLPVVQTTDSLEYDLTAAIKKVTKKEIVTIGFLTGHQEHGISGSSGGSTADTTNDYTSIATALEKLYDVQTVDVSSGQKIENIKTLIVAGPKTKISDREKFEIDQFIMGGGQVIFLVDGATVSQQLQATANDPGIYDLLENYGVKVNQDLVIDRSNETASFYNGYTQFMVPYPFWVSIRKENLKKDSPIISKIESMLLPWTSSLNITNKENITYDTLATSSEYASKVSAPFDLDPTQDFNLPSSPTDKIPLIVMAHGKFKSAFADKSIPAPESKGSEASSTQNDSSRQIIKESPDSARILVIGESDFITDQFIQQFQENAIFFSNAVDFLSQDSDLIQIRVKQLTDRPLKEVSEGKKTFVKFLGIALMAILFAVYGIVHFVLRRRRRKLSLS